MIFLILAAGMIFSTCEAPVRPVHTSINGTWNISWSFNGEELYGEVVFDQGMAHLRAYGADNSVLLSDYQEATFETEVSEQTLTLINEQSGVRMDYLIISRAPDRWELSYLNEITVRLQRKTN